MADEDDIDALTADFTRLRQSIAAELRRVAPQEDVSAPATAFSTVLADKDPPLPPAPPPMVQHTALPTGSGQPPMTPVADMYGDDEDVVPHFYSLRDNLLGKVPSTQGRHPPPAKSVPVSTPEEHANTVNIAVQPPQFKTGGLGAGVADPLSVEFQALRASINAKLRATTMEGLGAAGSSHKPTISAVAEEPGTAQSASSGFDPRAMERYAAAAAAPPQPPAGNTVVISARKPGAPGGPAPVMAALDARSAIAAARGNAPSGRPRGPFPVAASAGDGPSISIVAGEGGAGPATTIEYGGGAVSREVVFGHLAMKAALESHRLHYEAARSKLPEVALHRPTSGMLPPPPPPPATTARKIAAKPKAPQLKTAARARPKPEAAWADTMPESSLDRLKAAAVTGSQIKPDKPGKRGPGGKPVAKIPITRPKSAGAGGGGGGCSGVRSEPANQAPLMPVSGTGIAPTLETIRQTERLVAAVAASAKEAYDAEADEEAFDVTQYTEGIRGPPMSAQQAWVSAAEGEARQAEIIGSMAHRSAELYRQTKESLG